MFLALVTLGAAVCQADQPSDIVGRIAGDAIAVSGPMTVEVAGAQTQTILRSGADVRVKSGTARIDLVEGGQMMICGPAHLSVLKSGAALTVALNAGTVHVFVRDAPAITFYTAQIKAEPISIGEPGQETLVGIDVSGALCIHATRGAVRLEQQLSGQSLVVPQSGDVLISNGQFETLRSNAGHCACELQLADLARSQQLSGTEVSRLATRDEVASQDPSPKGPPSNSNEEVTYSVYNPPLVYDATKKTQPDFDPRLIVLVRRVRVRPTLIFQGRVQGEVIASANSPSPVEPSVPPTAPPAPASTNSKAGATTNDSFLNRMKAFMHRLWSRSS